MIRWLAPPLVAAVALVGSGFLSSLDHAAESSVRLAEATERAPGSTAEAAEELGTLPEVARLTSRQAELAAALVGALRVSAGRLRDVNRSLGSQAEDLASLAGAIDGLDPRLACIRERTADLVAASGTAPAELRSISGELEQVLRWQEKALRHLRSINRKLAALGVVAAATGVQPPPLPGSGPSPQPDEPPGAVPC